MIIGWTQIGHRTRSDAFGEVSDAVDIADEFWINL